MATTPTRKVPYPLPGDPINTYPTVAKALADLMDAEVLYLSSKPAADPPSTYPVGTSVLTLTTSGATNGGWPGSLSASVLSIIRYDSSGISIGTQLWSRSAATADLRVRSASGNVWGPWITLAYDPGWTTFTSTVTGTSRYRQVGNLVYVQVDGTVDIPSGSVQTLSTAPLPAAVRPSVVTRQGVSCTGYPGVLSVDTAGNVQIIQQTGATRTSVSGVMSYPLG